MQRYGLLGSSRLDCGRCAERLGAEILRGASLCMPLFSWELDKTSVSFSAAVSVSWGDFVSRLCLPAQCAEFVVFGLYQALCPLEGIVAVAEKEIQVISMPRGSSQVRLTCIFSAPLTHCRLQKRSGGSAHCPWVYVGVWALAVVKWEVSRLLDQQRGCTDGSGWGSNLDADLL